MAKNTRSNVYEGGLTVDPSVGPGVPGTLGALFIRVGTNQLWQKVTALDTGWQLKPFSSAVLSFGNNSVAAAADTRFLDQWGSTTTAGTVENIPIVAPRAGILRSLFVRHQAAVGNGNSVVYTVRINGVDTPITVTLASGAIGQASDLVNTAAVAQGDRITLRAMKAAGIGAGAVIPSATIEFV